MTCIHPPTPMPVAIMKNGRAKIKMEHFQYLRQLGGRNGRLNGVDPA